MSLTDQISAGFTAIATQLKTTRGQLGTLTSLTTTTKTSLVAALNELRTQARLPTGFNPATGGWAQPCNMLGSGAGTPLTGIAYLVPIDIGPNGLTVQSIGVNVTTALVAGSGTATYSLALYPDDGSGGAPNWAGRLTSGAITPTATGTSSLAYAATLTPGRYWAAFLFVLTTAVTTQAQFSCISNAAPALWVPNANPIGTAARALRVASLTSLPNTGPQTLGVTGNQDAPVVALRAA